MRNLKKLLALVLAMAMTFSLMLTASAANPVKTFDDAGQITEAFEEAADVLTGMKVFQGDEGGFRPGSTITRAEVAALIYRLSTGDVDDVRAGLYANYGNFKDVNESDWFAGYVGYCANAGYIKGYNGYFTPYGQVTGYEALAMVLRAIGYDKNHEFEGSTWQVNVSALGTQLNILDDIKTTDYANTLHLASRRDVVASILFNAAAYVNTVTYTPALGYETQKVSGGTADGWNGNTLGWVNFGLTWRTGIVVGNQDTGEDYTKLGLLYLDGYGYTDAGSYEYVSGDENISNGRNLTLSFNTDTGIDMFGHKYKIWFDGNSNRTVRDVTVSVGGGGGGGGTPQIQKVYDEYKTVYATFDKATLAAHVYSTNDNITSGSGLRGAAKGAGFANTDTTRWSDRYSRIQADDPQAAATSVTNIGNASYVNTYYLVSNNEDKTVDVAVVEHNELARINKKDTTANAKSLTLGNTNGVVSDFGYNTAADSPVNGSAKDAATNGTIAESRLTSDSVKDLGTIVLGTEILGTTKDLATRKPLPSEWRYKLEVPETEENQIVASAYSNSATAWYEYDPGDATEINLANGTTLKRSGIMEGKSAAGALTDGDKSHMISNCVMELTNQNMTFNQTYRIYKDKAGRFIGVTTGTDFTFLYGTFADYEVGALGTGTIGYAITGVNWDGEIVENHVLTSITASNGDVYRGNGGGSLTGSLAQGYSTSNRDNGINVMELTKKYLADATPGGTGGVGNQILPGVNTGFAIDSSGNAINGLAPNFDVVHDNRTLATIEKDNDWTITSADAANGFKSVTTARKGTVLLTNETTFLVVSGSGTSDLKVDKYIGMSEFLNGATTVTIDNDGHPGGYTYFLTRADRYNNMNTNSNDMIDTVIMSVEQVSGYSNRNLYFSNSTVPTGTMLNGEYEQFVMYNDGEKGYYFIESVDGNTTSRSGNTGMPDADRFYTLTQTRTVNGQPVYAANVVAAGAPGIAGDGVRTANGNFCWANAGTTAVPYSYVATTNMSTASFGGTLVADSDGIYRNTIDGTVYRVDNAKVVDLTNGTSTDSVSHAAFQSVLDLNNAVSSGWAINDVAIVNDGLNVSVIYVLSVTST